MDRGLKCKKHLVTPKINFIKIIDNADKYNQ